MLKKLRMALTVLEVAVHTKREARKLNEHVANLTHGADEGLEVIDAIGNAVQGDFGLDDTWVLGVHAFNAAPKIDQSLRRKIPWRYWRD